MKLLRFLTKNTETKDNQNQDNVNLYIKLSNFKKTFLKEKLIELSKEFLKSNKPKFKLGSQALINSPKNKWGTWIGPLYRPDDYTYPEVKILGYKVCVLKADDMMENDLNDLPHISKYQSESQFKRDINSIYQANKEKYLNNIYFEYQLEHVNKRLESKFYPKYKELPEYCLLYSNKEILAKKKKFLRIKRLEQELKLLKTEFNY